jgi:hypothetical protein
VAEGPEDVPTFRNYYLSSLSKKDVSMSITIQQLEMGYKLGKVSVSQKDATIMERYPGEVKNTFNNLFLINADCCCSIFLVIGVRSMRLIYFFYVGNFNSFLAIKFISIYNYGSHYLLHT